MNKATSLTTIKSLLRQQNPCQQSRWKVSSRIAETTFSNELVRGDRCPAVLRDRREFHSTPAVDLAVRRRRRSIKRDASNDGEDSNVTPGSNLQHTPVVDDVEFVQRASALMDKLEQALEPMKRINETFEVERFFGDMGEVLTINLGPKDGKYRIEMSLEDYQFEYSSPISGIILYILSAETGEWVGSQDGHSFEGLLVRDLNRQCQGLPKL